VFRGLIRWVKVLKEPTNSLGFIYYYYQTTYRRLITITPSLTTNKLFWSDLICWVNIKSKGIPRQAEVALGVPVRLTPRIFSTFGTTRVVCRQPNAPAVFTPGEIPGIHFQRLSRLQGTWFCRKEPRKKSSLTPPGPSD